MNKYAVGIILMVCWFALGFIIGTQMEKKEEQKYLDTIRYLEKNHYKQVLYSWKEEDYIKYHKYDNKSDYVAAVELQNEVYQDIETKYENRLMSDLITVNVRVAGLLIRNDSNLYKLPVQLEYTGGCGKDYCYRYDNTTHALSVDINYFALKSKLDQEPVFVRNDFGPGWVCNVDNAQCVNEDLRNTVYLNNISWP